MVEGSLWVYGRTDLTDFYRGALTLRQVYTRLICLPEEAPIVWLLEQEREKAEARRTADDIQDVITSFQK